MSVKKKTFVELLAAGKAGPGDIDAFIAAWHKGKDKRDLPSAIGLTAQQYAEWVGGKVSIMDFVPSPAIKRHRKLAAA